MKFKNLEVGMVVKVKKSNDSFSGCYSGKYGKVLRLDGDIKAQLNVYVDFGTDGDWGNSKDLKYKDADGNLFTHDMLDSNNCVVDMTKITKQNLDTNKPIKSDGLNSSYYDIYLPDWLIKQLTKRKEEGNCYIKTEELIEVVFKDDFSFGTLFKSLVRAFGVTQGQGKAGNSLDYELNKVSYYTDKIRSISKRNKREEK